MNKIPAKALLIAGLVVMFGMPILPTILALFFPTLSGDSGLLMACFLCSPSLGVVLLVLAQAKNRLENGDVDADGLFRALTPAQICLMISMLLLTAGMAIGALGNEEFGGIVVFFAMIGIVASIILAIVRGAVRSAEIRRERERRLVALDLSRRPVPSDVQTVPKEYCERCGHAFDKGTLEEFHGYKLCYSCVAMMKKAEQAEKLKEMVKCSACGAEYKKDKMIFVDDEYLCSDCFHSRYDDPPPVG